MVLVGLLVFYREHLQVILSGRTALQTGIVWVLIAAVTWAVYSVLLKVLVLKHPPMQLNLVIFGLPALLYLPFVQFDHFIGIGLTGWLILLFLGLNTLFAYGLLALAIHYVEANKISVILVLNPLLTLALMAILGRAGVSWIEHEHFTRVTMAGALIVITGAVLTILRKNKPANSLLKRND
jgi:drug/metabolite transporter (DMT)-like permease